MRKTLITLALTAALTGGTATVALAADDATTPALAQSTQENADSNESDKTGLWGLLGLLGLAGRAKRKENNDVDLQARR